MKKSKTRQTLTDESADLQGPNEGDAPGETIIAEDAAVAETAAEPTATSAAADEADEETPADLALVPQPTRTPENLVTPAMRQAAAERALALRTSPAQVESGAEALPAGLDPNAPPDYFGPYPNYANSLFPALDPVTGKVIPGTGMRKFFDSLAGVGPANANNLHNYIPIAAPDTITYTGCDYYEIALKRYKQKMSSDLPATQLQGYVQINFGTDAHGHNTIAPPLTRITSAL